VAAAGVAHIPWYSTLFRGDQLEEALAEIAPVALRYGARSFHVYRYSDDRYKFLQTAEFEQKIDFDRYWQGPEFSVWRARTQGWWQVPIVPGFTDLIASGSLIEPGEGHTARAEADNGMGGEETAS